MLVQLHTRKNEPALATDLWGIVASTELPQSEFLHFKNNLLDDYPFIAECAERLHVDENGIARGLLVLCKDLDDGILVNSEGRSYAKDSAYLPGARSLVLLDNHPSLKDFCTQMTGLVDKYVLEILDRQSDGEAEISYEHLEPNEPGYFSREYGGKKSWWTDEYKLARKYLYGSEDASPDPVRAMELLQREAEKGNGFALYDLGLMARNGFGCEKNDVVAQERFRKALAAFMAEESRSKKLDYWQYRIGKMYAMGYGADQDFRKAAEWYEKAAAEGNPFAAYALGCLYRRGQGVERDEARAIAYFQVAAAHGNEFAQRLLDSLNATSEAQSWSVTNAALSLMRQTAGVFQDKFRDLDNEHMRHTDRKLMSKIAEKKLAQGQKLGG